MGSLQVDRFRMVLFSFIKTIKRSITAVLMRESNLALFRTIEAPDWMSFVRVMPVMLLFHCFSSNRIKIS